MDLAPKISEDLFRQYVSIFQVREEDDVDNALGQCLGLGGSLVRLYGCAEDYLFLFRFI